MEGTYHCDIAYAATAMTKFNISAIRIISEDAGDETHRQSDRTRTGRLPNRHNIFPSILQLVDGIINNHSTLMFARDPTLRTNSSSPTASASASSLYFSLSFESTRLNAPLRLREYYAPAHRDSKSVLFS